VCVIKLDVTFSER